MSQVPNPVWPGQRKAGSGEQETGAAQQTGPAPWAEKALEGLKGGAGDARKIGPTLGPEGAPQKKHVGSTARETARARRKSRRAQQCG